MEFVGAFRGTRENWGLSSHVRINIGILGGILRAVSLGACGGGVGISGDLDLFEVEGGVIGMLKVFLVGCFIRIHVILKFDWCG